MDPLRIVRVTRWPILVAITCITPSLAAQQGPPERTPVLLPGVLPAVVEAATLSEAVGQVVWPGLQDAPVQLLLVADSLEYFFPIPRNGKVEWTRRRVFPATFQATFPAVGGVPTIVIGTPEGTATPRDRWTLTVLHEHFHQLQYSRPDYYTRLNALGLARGDTTGMWALNFPFPYDSAPIQAAVKRWADAMRAALTADSGVRQRTARQAREAKRALDALLAPDDRKYLDFQLWQEGVPRWIELAGAREGRRAGLVRDSTLAWQERRLLDDLTRIDLGRDRRVVVYALGAAMAELMEREGKEWRERYFERMFALDP